MEQSPESSLDGFVAGEPRSTAAPSTPGSRLKAAREARGLSREQLCEAIQLERRLLDALEDDRFEAFDAPVFARGFIRKAASHLGLEPAELLAGYDRLQRGPEAPTHIPPTTRITPKRVSPWRLPLLGLMAVLAVGAVVWWVVAGLGGVGSPVAETAPADDSALVVDEAPPAALPPEAVAAPQDNAAGNAAGNAGGNAEGSGAVDAPVPANGGADLAAPAVAAAAPGAAPAAAPAAPPGPVDRAALQFQFSGSSWLNVVGPDGRRLYVGMASPGVLPFAGSGPWQVLVGDVRQVRVTVGGRELVLPKPAPGENNVVRFTVTADGQLR